MHLLLIEDDPAIAKELMLRWTARDWRLRHAATLGQARTLRAQAAFDIVVLDLGLPDGDGLDWLAELRRYDKLTPVLALTARDRTVDRVRGLNSGADDYLVKPFDGDELDARISALVRRAGIARGELVSFGGLTWLGSEGRAYAGTTELELSPREFEVLGLLIKRAPRLATKRELLDALAERNLEVGDNAVETYVSRLRRRIAGSGTVIRTLHGFGYVLELEQS